MADISKITTDDNVTYELKDATARQQIAAVRQVPASAAADAGKFLRVNSSGAAAWQTVPNANGVSF